MVLTLVLFKYSQRSLDVQLSKSLSDFPTKLGEWLGKEAFFDKQVYDILGVDDSFLCNYSTPDGRRLQLFIAYFRSQRQGSLAHSPKNCMPGAGWNIMETSTEQITYTASTPRQIGVTKLVLKKHGEKQILFYWFQSRGRFISSEYSEKIYLVWDSLFKRRTDGSFIRLISPVHHDEIYTTGYMRRFAQAVIPILEEYVPGGSLPRELPR